MVAKFTIMYLRFINTFILLNAVFGFSKLDLKKFNTKLLLRPFQERNTNVEIFGDIRPVKKKIEIIEAIEENESIIDVKPFIKENTPAVIYETNEVINSEPKKRLKAKWLPIIDIYAPENLDGSFAGDAGFDPLGFSKSKKSLYWMREAEIKHSRLAMLGALGWPLSEVIHNKLANSLHLDSVLASGGRAPSILNGGLSSKYASFTLLFTLLITGYLESLSMNKGIIFWNAEKPKGYVPGDYGFDPLNLYNLKGDKKLMETAEIKNGRLAMIAITIFVIREAITGLPVINI